MNRFNTALALNEGASNPIAVAREVFKIVEDAHQSGISTEQICNDPAVRLAVHQLAHLTGQSAMFRSHEEYCVVFEACLEKA